MSDSKNCVIITGACGGIGSALVRAYLRENYFVVAIDKRFDGDAVDNESASLKIDVLETVRNEKYADNCFNKIKNICAGKRIFALINNAAIQIVSPSEHLTVDDWHTTLDANLLAPFLWSKRLLNELEKANGSILNISSIHSKLTKKGFVAYATSKSALSGMTRALAVDLMDRVRVNAIEPAAIETQMLMDGFKDNIELYNNLKSYHPINRIGSVEDVANLALFLTSKDASFVHGSCIGIDGGIASRLYDPV